MPMLVTGMTMKVVSWPQGQPGETTQTGQQWVKPAHDGRGCVEALGP